ncbi:hypothetical protein AAFF_G00042100 [Aldrovandia affinis]|uniref:Uncharacterized protein n=1 Tax=Aldrovandia affinis TaxID=143900 RepID=A0AAD7S2K8_9TELE|nr:hypothetical protein AAFF_G00042100 [Aldrovandia affinis]
MLLGPDPLLKQFYFLHSPVQKRIYNEKKGQFEVKKNSPVELVKKVAGDIQGLLASKRKALEVWAWFGIARGTERTLRQTGAKREPQGALRLQSSPNSTALIYGTGGLERQTVTLVNPRAGGTAVCLGLGGAAGTSGTLQTGGGKSFGVEALQTERFKSLNGTEASRHCRCPRARGDKPRV